MFKCGFGLKNEMKSVVLKKKRTELAAAASSGAQRRRLEAIAKDRPSLEREISSVAEERDALARAVAFARNYIDVEAQSREAIEAEWKLKLERLEEENRA